MIPLDAPGTHPAVDLGCGTFCTFNYESLISTLIAAVVTVIIGFIVRAILVNGRPNRLQALFEWLYGYVNREGKTNAPDSAFVVPLAASIGIYILVANWLDVFPFDAAGLPPANADLNQTLAMSLVVIFLVEAYSIRVLGFGGFLRKFTKPFGANIVIRIVFVPLNIIEEVVKPVTLALRLFGNVFAGTVMVFLLGLLIGLPLAQVNHFSIVGGVLSVLATAGWKAFDVIFIGAIQAFIFMLLTMIYFGQAREGLEEEHA